MPVLIVAGPTASGKTALSIQMARDLRGEIVNSDSVQVYKEADIGSAKLPPDERSGIPHHLIDCFSPDEKCDAGIFCEYARQSIAGIFSRGAQPVIAGGTTLYITALLHGLIDLPPSDKESRKAMEAISTEALYQQLEVKDPVSALRIHPNDRLRISRALEVSELSGRPASEVIREHRYSITQFTALIIVLCRERESLYDRINQRTRTMLAQGLLQESEAILKRHGPDLPLFRAIGYSQALRCLQGSLPESELESEIAMQTRRYAKRQMTFWRNEPLKRGWSINPSQANVKEGKPGFISFETLHWSYEELLAHARRRLDGGMEKSEVWYLEPGTLGL